MREISFRAKRIKDGAWVCGPLFYYDGCVAIGWNHGIEVDEEGLKPYTYDFVDHKTVSEYTGINDSEELYIYENDLVKYGSYIGCAKFENGAFGLAYFDEEGNAIFTPFILLKVNNCMRMPELKIVGNRFDTPCATKVDIEKLLEQEG